MADSFRAGVEKLLSHEEMAQCENYETPALWSSAGGQDCITAGPEVLAAEGCWPCRLRALLIANPEFPPITHEATGERVTDG